MAMDKEPIQSKQESLTEIEKETLHRVPKTIYKTIFFPNDSNLTKEDLLSIINKAPEINEYDVCGIKPEKSVDKEVLIELLTKHPELKAIKDLKRHYYDKVQKDFDLDENEVFGLSDEKFTDILREKAVAIKDKESKK